MNLLQLYRGIKQFGNRTLFNDVGFSINEGEHVGVIGPNGAGKTTLFKIITGEESLDSGELVKSQQLRMGYLEQESEWSLNQSCETYLSENCIKPVWELKQIGRSLGLTEDYFARTLGQLSGGYRMRMKLLYLIGQEPNLMLLDEPTNFLDLESLLALENFLQSYRGAFMLISHDREFLRRTTEATLEIEGGDITKFPGHIDDYFEQKIQLRQVLESKASNQESKRKQIQDFVDRFRAKATKARQAQSRMKRLEKMEVIELKDLPVQAKIAIPSPIHTGKESLMLESADLGYGDKKILSKVQLRLERGAHLGVVGYNGVGKSTLLKSLGQRIPLLSGKLTYGYQVTFSYFAQHVTEEIDLNDTVLEAFQRTAHHEVKAQEILNLAGSLLFSGDDVKKKIKSLSGGEKSRVALGRILLKRSPLLLMDEPTNHLDFETVEALTEALRDYEGTLIVVSHDRSFIRRVANQILEIRDGGADIYPGSYDDYVWSLEKGALKNRESVVSAASASSVASLKDIVESSLSAAESQPIKNNFREETKRLEASLRMSQKRIKQCEEDITNFSNIRDQLNENLLKVKGQAAQEIAKELSLVSNKIQEREEEMLNLMEKLETEEKELLALRQGSSR